MKSTESSIRPPESSRSPTKPPLESQASARRRRREDDEEDEDGTTGNDKIDGEPTEAEEKLKVVVRVRPLQKNEVPWSTAPGAGEEYGVASVQKQKPSGGLSSPKNDVSSPTESELSVHEKSVLWEKNGQIKMLLADAVFSGDATQDEVFHSVEDCIDGLLAGFDCSVFAYGQTGTGKTHTMSGLPHRGGVPDDCEAGSFEMADNYGVVPRCIQRLFDQVIEHESKGISFSVYCSFIEIYNERIYDILSSDNGIAALNASTSTHRNPHDSRTGWNRPQPTKEAPSLQIRQKLDKTVFVDGLTSRRVSTTAEMLRAFREGSMNREVRDNLYNQHSSRGHSIFQVTLRKNVPEATSVAVKGSTSPRRPPSVSRQAGSNTKSTQSRLSRLFFVDLAGSEKWHVNGSDLSERYAAELSSINKSLSALTNCVLALTQKERPHVPYRDSVLTRLLQSCLQGHGRTAFIVTISPARESLEESFATLRFAERLKALRCRPIRRKIFANEPLMGEQRVYYENQIHSMRMEVNRLRELLKKAHRRNQEITDNTAAAAANAALVDENRRLKELLMHSERNRLAERGGRLNEKPSKGGAAVTVGPSPQRQAAKQILASRQRPLSDEEVANVKSDSVSDMSGDLNSSRIPPSTSQPRPNPIRKDDRGVGTEETMMSSDEKEYSTLINRLQDKEARLNWMLEAELEAQNTRGSSLSTMEKVTTQSTNSGNSGSDPVPTDKATGSRSWAVERVLRRHLVVVPPPVRSGSISMPQDQAVAKVNLPRPAPTTLESTEGTTSVRQQSATRPRPVLPPGDGKLNSPRHPTSTTLGDGSQTSKILHTPYQPSHAQTTQRPSSTARRPKRDQASSPQAKVVGSSSSSDTKGKSKEELADDYKRARRAELEAMLRTMVHP